MTPDIVRAVQDPNLFLSYVAGDDGDLASWVNWLTMLKVLYGLPLEETEHGMVRAYTGRDPDKLPQTGFSEALVLAGRRSGKSRIIALCAAAEAVLSGREQKLSAGEIGLVAVMSPTRFQSRIIHQYARAVFDSSPLLQREVVEETRDGFKLKNGVEIVIATGDPRTGIRGYTGIALICDEISFFGLTEESKVKSDTELVRALRPALATTGGRLLCVGTPFKAAGYSYQTWKRGFGNDEADVLVWNAPSLVMNPTLPASVVQRAVAEDPVAARVEYAVQPGLFREDVDEFISRAAVEALVVPGRKELPPRRDVAHAAFCDVSGGRADDAALCVGHKEGRVIVLDLLERWKAPHNPHQVVAGMADVLGRYGIQRLIGDCYSAEWVRTAFAEHGIDYRHSSTSVWKEGSQVKNKVLKPKSVLYAELLPRLTSAEVELLDNDTLVSQLASLQRRTRSGARDSIDHPPGGKDDLANCLAGVCDAVSQRKITAGVATADRRPDGNADESPLERHLRRTRRSCASLQDYDERIARGHAQNEHVEGFVRAMAERFGKDAVRRRLGL